MQLASTSDLRCCPAAHALEARAASAPNVGAIRCIHLPSRYPSSHPPLGADMGAKPEEVCDLEVQGIWYAQLQS